MNIPNKKPKEKLFDRTNIEKMSGQTNPGVVTFKTQ